MTLRDYVEAIAEALVVVLVLLPILLAAWRNK